MQTVHPVWVSSLFPHINPKTRAHSNHFRNRDSIKMWKVFNNGNQTSPTSTLRKHFKHEHFHVWNYECLCLKVPWTSTTHQMSSSIAELFTRDGLMKRLQKFVVAGDQVCLHFFLISSCVTHKCMQSINVVESPHFRDILLYIGQGGVTLLNNEIPGRTCLKESIIKTWRQERELFYEEMKVSYVCLLCQLFLMIMQFSVELVRMCVTYNRCLVRSRPCSISCCNSSLRRAGVQRVTRSTNLEVWPTRIPAHPWISHWRKSCKSSLHDHQRCWHRTKSILFLSYLGIV